MKYAQLSVDIFLPFYILFYVVAIYNIRSALCGAKSRCKSILKSIAKAAVTVRREKITRFRGFFVLLKGYLL